MKFQLPSLKTIGQLLLALLAAIAIGTGLLTLSYLLPGDKIGANVADSIYIFQEEGTYPSLDESYVCGLDNFTDAIILKEAAYAGNESAFQKAMLCPSCLLTDREYDDTVEELIRSYTHPELSSAVTSYARYWHGHLIFLKAALQFLNYGQIRTANLYIQFILLALIVILLIIKKSWQMIPAYIVTALLLRPEVSAYSLQHATIYYIILTASILLLLFNEKLKSKNLILIFFLLLGASVSYLDYLTYPLAAFGIPAVLFVFLNRRDRHCDVRFIINLLVCWLAGYIGMWAGKWILATVFTDQNVIRDALDTIMFRTGSGDGEKSYSYIKTLTETFKNFFFTPYTPVYIFLLIIEGVVFRSWHRKHSLKETLSFATVALLPLLWYAFTINHSYIHAELFTYKEWAISVFALFALFANFEFKGRRKKSSASS